MVWSRANGAGCKGTQASINEVGFLLGQLPSAVAAEYAILLVHTFTPYDCGTRLSETMNSAGNAVPGLKIVAPARRHLVSANRPTLANRGITVFVGTS